MARASSKDFNNSAQLYSVAHSKRFAVSSKGTQVRDGLPYPRSAWWDGEGVNFALFSANVTKVELCLFDELGKKELQRIELPGYTDEIWHRYLVGLEPGTARNSLRLSWLTGLSPLSQLPGPRLAALPLHSTPARHNRGGIRRCGVENLAD